MINRNEHEAVSKHGPFRSYLSRYLSRYKDQLDDYYLWHFDENKPKKRFGFSFAGGNDLQRTIELKRQLSAAALDRKLDRAALAAYFVTDWGGINTSKIDAIVGDCEPFEGKPKRVPVTLRFDGISSWSKWLSIVCPDWALIYDARVAFSLNAINYIEQAREKVFPMPPGRNATISLLDSATLALSNLLTGFNRRDAKSIKKELFWNKKNAYDQYLSLAETTHEELWGTQRDLACTEMLLFALADTKIFDDLVEAVQHA